MRWLGIRTRDRHRVSLCDRTQSHVTKEHRGDRGHKDAGIKETLLRGDPLRVERKAEGSRSSVMASCVEVAEGHGH
jgi:hypothetical protein